MSSNRAAYVVAEKSLPLRIQDAPGHVPGPDELVIKNAAIALTPLDWMIPTMGSALFDHIKYPYLGGGDVAGEVVQVGSNVTRFRKGDRILAHSVSFAENNPVYGGFQNYTLLKSQMTAAIPAHLSFEKAAVIPVGVSTAACAFYQKGYLELQYPSITPKPTGKTLLVWAGSSSVGSSGIQLGVASGYDVITTASPKNFEYCKKLGASQVFDYRSPTLTEDLLKAVEGKDFAGAFAILPGSAEICVEIASRAKGGKFVALTTPPPDNVPESVSTKFVLASAIRNSEVSRVIYGEYLPQALAQGTFVPAPEPLVVGSGLESLQHALEVQQKGVSARKVVVTL